MDTQGIKEADEGDSIGNLYFFLFKSRKKLKDSKDVDDLECNQGNKDYHAQKSNQVLSSAIRIHFSNSPVGGQ